MTPSWTLQEASRTVVFGPDAMEQAESWLPPKEYVLITTARALSEFGERLIVSDASQIVEVPNGPVDQLATKLAPAITDLFSGSPPDIPSTQPWLVALGGGRIIDVAKAVAADIDPSPKVAAIPTTLSGAEMTSIHRRSSASTGHGEQIRPTLVINDPRISASQPMPELAASAANAYAHALEALLGVKGSPISDTIAIEAIRLLQHGIKPSKPERTLLAQGALLAGWALDHSGIGLHHALAQSVVRVCSTPHSTTNAGLLPFTTRALLSRMSKQETANNLGIPTGELEGTAVRFARLSGADAGLQAIGATTTSLHEAALLASERKELENTPPVAKFQELEQILSQAS